MSVQQVTLDLPDGVYEQIRRAAERTHRPIHELLVEAVSAVAPVAGSATAPVRTALAQMAWLNDAALWQAARTTLAPVQRERLAALHDKQQREGLGPAEQDEERALLALYRETLLVRAQAAVLLGQRGYDVREPGQFEPLE